MCTQWALLENINVCPPSYHRSGSPAQLKSHQATPPPDYWVCIYLYPRAKA